MSFEPVPSWYTILKPKILKYGVTQGASKESLLLLIIRAIKNKDFTTAELGLLNLIYYESSGIANMCFYSRNCNPIDIFMINVTDLAKNKRLKEFESLAQLCRENCKEMYIIGFITECYDSPRSPYIDAFYYKLYKIEYTQGNETKTEYVLEPCSSVEWKYITKILDIFDRVKHLEEQEKEIEKLLKSKKESEKKEEVVHEEEISVSEHEENIEEEPDETKL